MQNLIVIPGASYCMFRWKDPLQIVHWLYETKIRCRLLYWLYEVEMKLKLDAEYLQRSTLSSVGTFALLRRLELWRSLIRAQLLKTPVKMTKLIGKEEDEEAKTRLQRRRWDPFRKAEVMSRSFREYQDAKMSRSFPEYRDADDYQDEEETLWRISGAEDAAEEATRRSYWTRLQRNRELLKDFLTCKIT